MAPIPGTPCLTKGVFTLLRSVHATNTTMPYFFPSQSFDHTKLPLLKAADTNGKRLDQLHWSNAALTVSLHVTNEASKSQKIWGETQ